MGLVLFVTIVATLLFLCFLFLFLVFYYFEKEAKTQEVISKKEENQKIYFVSSKKTTSHENWYIQKLLKREPNECVKPYRVYDMFHALDLDDLTNENDATRANAAGLRKAFNYC